MKKCRLCKKEVEDEARKCPYCQSWQGRVRSALDTFVAKTFIVILVFGAVALIIDKFDGPSEYERATELKLRTGQLDSIEVSGSGFRIEKDDCFEKQFIGNLQIRNGLQRELSSLEIQISLFKKDSLIFAFGESMHRNIQAKTAISHTVSETMKTVRALDFDSIAYEAMSAHFEI